MSRATLDDMPGCINEIKGKARFKNKEFQDLISIKKNGEEKQILTNENNIFLPADYDFLDIVQPESNLNLACYSSFDARKESFVGNEKKEIKAIIELFNANIAIVQRKLGDFLSAEMVEHHGEMQAIMSENPSYQEMGTLLKFAIQNRYIYIPSNPNSRSDRYLYHPKMLALLYQNSNITDSSSRKIQLNSSRSQSNIGVFEPIAEVPPYGESEETNEYEFEEQNKTSEVEEQENEKYDDATDFSFSPTTSEKYDDATDCSISKTVSDATSRFGRKVTEYQQY